MPWQWVSELLQDAVAQTQAWKHRHILWASQAGSAGWSQLWGMQIMAFHHDTSINRKDCSNSRSRTLASGGYSGQLPAWPRRAVATVGGPCCCRSLGSSVIDVKTGGLAGWGLKNRGGERTGEIIRGCARVP
jgi:hypothetical protein